MDYTPPPRNLAELTADCADCAALCCVAPPAFDKGGEDFAIAKLPPLTPPCVHLQDDNLCKLHTELEDHGFPGCARFDCLGGAGQHVVQGSTTALTGATTRRCWRTWPKVTAACNACMRRCR